MPARQRLTMGLTRLRDLSLCLSAGAQQPQAIRPPRVRLPFAIPEWNWL